ncbi:MAG: insulinase family protein [Saprospiraceae bacterium]|nr:insulinase family protein [Saprospiraceae bacterium]
MIQFEKFQLENGLRVILHEDNSTPLVAVNLLYDVGSRDEMPERTGFAHLFEHLMFAGSKNVRDFDKPIQEAGGENNAFTNNDMTNFYATAPAENLETLLWLESDRMLSLSITARALKTQQKVVVEEFKETTLNEPYGDLWHLLSPLVYKKHPYRWPVIGQEPRHIEEATLDDVKGFYKKYYVPNNAILVVAGNFDKIKTAINNEKADKSTVKTPTLHIRSIIEKWFGAIPASVLTARQLPQEPAQTGAERKEITAKVPLDAIFIAFRSPARLEKDYYTVDLMTDVLSNGTSSRFYRRLLKDKQLFSEIDCFQSGSLDPGIVIVEGKPSEGISLETAEKAIWEELELMKKEVIAELELQKLKNKVESQQAFSDAGALNKAMNLAYYELLGDADLINTEAEKYNAITVLDIQRVAQEIFRPENATTLIYRAEKETKIV